MNKNSTDFIKALTARTFEKIHNHVSKIEVPDEDKSNLAFKIYEAHANALVAHMIDVFVDEDWVEQAVDEVTNDMNQFVKHFIKNKLERAKEQV
jgi:hypothetical protein